MINWCGRVFVRPLTSVAGLVMQPTFANMMAQGVQLSIKHLTTEKPQRILLNESEQRGDNWDVKRSVTGDELIINLFIARDDFDNGDVLLAVEFDGGLIASAYISFIRFPVFNDWQPRVTTFNVANTTFNFLIDNPHDEIQGRYLLKGKIYEQHILDNLIAKLPVRSRVLDIGANVGNHAIYLEKMAACEEIICFEANPKTCDLLLQNIALNECRAINCRYIGLCVSDDDASYVIANEHKNNLGATAFATEANSEEKQGVSSIWLDKALSINKLDCIKIDVEGMEMQVLNGMKAIIHQHQPIVLIEVNTDTAAAFYKWLDDNDYVIDSSYHPYPENWMFIVRPKYPFVS